jgi:hypothetical protein
VINVDPDDRRTWYSTDGVMRIRDAGEAGPCPLKGPRDRMRIADVEVQMDTLGQMP